MRLKLDARARRILRRMPVVNVYSVVELALLAGLAVQCARLAWTIVTPITPLGDWRPATPMVVGAPADILRGFDPFFRLGGAAGQPATVTSLQLTLFGTRMVALWIPDFLFAFLFGIGFQYWSIVPMRQLSPGEGIRAALKADVLSIGAWQIGMYGGMALIQFLWFAPQFGGLAEPGQPEFWMAMQIAMLAGFCTSYPMNWLLVRNGVKEAM